MGIRKILYGYEIRAGRKEICPGEAEIVRQVFALYPAGFSYQKIAEALNQRNVSYGETNSPWNKARIKRILEDKRYTGQKGYPVMIKEADFQAVQSTIQNNSIKRTQTAPEPEEVYSEFDFPPLIIPDLPPIETPMIEPPPPPPPPPPPVPEKGPRGPTTISPSLVIYR